MAPRVTYSNWPLSGLMNDIAGTTFRPPASLPLPPVSGWASGEPAAALPPPLNLHDRSIAVPSAWKVFLSKVDITDGLLATNEASPLDEQAPARHRPWELGRPRGWEA